jgi:starch synthase
MRVVLLDFTFFAYAVSLANALSDLCEVTLMLPDRAARSYDERTKKEVSRFRFHMPRLRYPANVFMVRSLFGTIRRTRPDVVHQLAWHPWFNLALPLFPPVPLVTTIHDVKHHPGDKASVSLFVRSQWKGADRIIVHTKSVSQQLLELDPDLEKRVHIVPHGAYDFYRTGEEAVVEEAGPPTVLFFGRIWEYKGLQYLIEAEPLISRQVPDLRIVIAGCGEPFEKYEKMMVNRDRFVVHNYEIPDAKVASLFRQASIVALPYVEASQSGVMAIAYAFGKPVVASAVGGIPEAVEHGKSGYLVPPRDVNSLAEAITRLLLDKKLRQSMGKSAFEKSGRELSWAAIAQSTVAVYRATLDDKIAGPK